MKKVDIDAFWVPSMMTGKVLFKTNDQKYIIAWDDEETIRTTPYTKEDIKSGDLILGKTVRLLYGPK